MNWREHPYLFANGEFYARGGGGTGIIKEFTIYEDGSKCFTVHDNDGFWIVDIKNECILIARKIEDITCEEYNERDQIIYTVRDGVHGVVKFRDESPESFLYLLSIGVYPFDQSHFEDGTVIDAKTI